MEPAAPATMLLHCAREYTWEQGAWRWEGMNRTEYVNNYILMKGKGDEMACGSHGKGGIRGSSSFAKNGGKGSKFNELNELLGEVESLKNQLSFERRAREKAELALKSRPCASSDLGLCAPWEQIDQHHRSDHQPPLVPGNDRPHKDYQVNDQQVQRMDNDHVSDVSQDNHADASDDPVPAATTLKRQNKVNQQVGSISDSDVPSLGPSSGDEVDDARPKPLQPCLQREPLPRDVDSSDLVDPYDDVNEAYLAQLRLAQILRNYKSTLPQVPDTPVPSMITSSDDGLPVIASHARSSDSEEP